MQYIPADFVGLVFIPFTFTIFLLVHFRAHFNPINAKLQAINLWSKGSRLRQSEIILFATFFALIWSFIIGLIVFPYSDVDEAMVAGIKGFLSGNNPYTQEIVPHILLTPDGKETVYGTYNYGPVDLVVYAIGYTIFSPLFGDVWWLFVTNIILLVGIYSFLAVFSYQEISHPIKIIPFMFLMGWFLQDNSVLMCFLLAIAWYIHLNIDSTKWYKYPLITFVFTLAVLTKLYLAFVLAGYFLFVLKEDLIRWGQNILVGIITTVLVIVPFDFWGVINSIFLFHSNLDYREDFATIQGGIPAILEILGYRDLFLYVAIIYSLIVLIFSYYYAKDQLALNFCVLSIFFLLLLPSSVFAFFIIPSFFMLAQYFENVSMSPQK